MIGTRTLAPAALAVLLLVGAMARAQTDEDAAAATDTQPAAADTDKTGGNNGGTAGGAGRSPSDYRASEKISEDLPVSFPVDI